jgi:PAS domain S-box-containing protein
MSKGSPPSDPVELLARIAALEAENAALRARLEQPADSQRAAVPVDDAGPLQPAGHRERRFRALLEHSSDGIAVIDANNNIQYLSPAVATIEGYSADELIGGNGKDNTHVDDLPLVHDTVRRALENPGLPIPVTWRRRHKDGRWLWLEGVATNLMHDPAVRGIVTNYRDVTLRKRAEEAQIRSQKMEALGTLAGGIAHDFNNILQAIIGNAALAIGELAVDHRALESLVEIDKASQRATDLVRQILSFSRQEEPKRSVLDLRAIVDEAVRLVRATLPASIQLSRRFERDVGKVSADATQIHQSIVNLATNAAQAIGDRGGVIELVVDAASVSGDPAGMPREIAAGRYARVSVSDNGCGMDSATQQRVFDPFFTTKPVGQGTGLGLSVVHGIMKAHDGAVTVYSQPSKGTTFRLYFPVVDAEVATPLPPPRANLPGNQRRVLYVDDDAALVLLASRSLARQGYRVSAFSDPKLALEAFLASPDAFDVAISDLSMPGLSGFDLARALHQHRPQLPILMTSGYVRPEDRDAARERGIVDLLLKPTSMEDLGRALDELLRVEPDRTDADSPRVPKG